MNRNDFENYLSTSLLLAATLASWLLIIGGLVMIYKGLGL
jgi:hypothetical protein